jgi:hypothetical protein
MTTIHDLNTSIVDMTREEVFGLIKQIRFSRRNPHKKTTTTSRSPKKKKEVDISAIMQSMSKDAKSALLKELEGLV